MKKYFLLVCTLFVYQPSFSQIYKWAKSVGGTQNDVPTETITDGVGNLITTGVFAGTVDFDPGTGIVNLTSAGSSYWDAFIMKTDPAGNLVWVKQIGAGGADKGLSVTVDASDNIYVAGYFSDSVDFDPGSGVFKLSPDVNSHTVPFLLKLNSSGNFLWATKQESIFSPEAVDIATAKTSVRVDNAGDVFIAYDFKSHYALQIDKYSGSGTKIWSNYFLYKTNTSEVYYPSLAIDPSGNPILAGRFNGDIDFNPKGASNVIFGPAFSIFVAKLSGSTGNVTWLDRFDNCPLVYSLTTDATGNIIMGGATGSDPVDLDPGPGVYSVPGGSGLYGFILKLTNTGTLSWGHPYGTSYPYGICTDASSNIYATGYYKYTVDFDPSLSDAILNNPSADNIFILKLTPSGLFGWVKEMGGNGAEEGLSIAVSKTNAIYTVGRFYTTVDFDYPNGSNLNANGFDDIFIHKVESCGTIDNSVTKNGGVLSANLLGATYQWVTCPNMIPITNASSKIFTPSSSGSYAVILNQNGCIDTSSCQYVFANSIVHHSNNINAHIFPNPFNDFFTIDMGKPYNNITIEVRSLLGITVFKQTYTNKQMIPVKASLPSGTYIVNIVTDNGERAILKTVKGE